MTFEELCTFEVLYDAYLTARVGKRSKAGTAQYEAQALACTQRLVHLDRMKARTRGWRKDKEAGTLDVARTVNRWKAWDAHAAHGDTFELRKQIAAIVSEITGVTCTARPPIRAGKYDKAKEAVRKVNRQRRRPPAPAQQKVPTGFPW